MKSETKSTQRESLRDKVRRMADEKQHKGGGQQLNLPEGVEFWKPKKNSFIDIIPFAIKSEKHAWVSKGSLWYESTYLLHNNIGSERKSYICPKTINKKCPICEHQMLMRKEGQDKDLIDALKAKERQVFNIIDLNSDDAAIKVWDISYHLFGKQLEEEIRNQDPEVADFFLLRGGYSLKIRFTEKSFKGHDFLETSRIDFTDRKEYNEKMLTKVVNLEEALNIIPYDNLKKIFFEIADDEEEEEEKKDRSFDSDREDYAKRDSRKKDDVDDELVQHTRRRRSEPEDEPNEEDTKEEAKPRSRRGESPKTEKNPCPAGHRFGIDTDKKDECAECGDEWQDCTEKKDELNKATRKR